jgi:hypothetical protein
LYKRIFILMLLVSLVGTSFGLHSVWAQTAGEADLAALGRAKVERFGVSRNAQVEVKLRDHTKMKGYISSVEQNSFTLTDPKRGETRVDYADVVTVKKSSSGLSTRSWIMIGAAAVGAVVTWIVVKPAACDGGAQSRFPC